MGAKGSQKSHRPAAEAEPGAIELHQAQRGPTGRLGASHASGTSIGRGTTTKRPAAVADYAALSRTSKPGSDAHNTLADEELVFLMNRLLNGDRALLQDAIASFFHPDARLINPLVRVQGRTLICRIYRCATLLNRQRAAVHKVYHAHDGEAAIDATLYITFKWLPLLTVRIPMTVLVKFRQLLDRPLIVEQYDHYGPLMAPVCTVPLAQFLLETLVQPTVGYSAAMLGALADFVEDVVQVRLQQVAAFKSEVTNWLYWQFIEPLRRPAAVLPAFAKKGEEAEAAAGVGGGGWEVDKAAGAAEEVTQELVQKVAEKL